MKILGGTVRVRHLIMRSEVRSIAAVEFQLKSATTDWCRRPGSSALMILLGFRSLHPRFHCYSQNWLHVCFCVFIPYLRASIEIFVVAVDHFFCGFWTNGIDGATSCMRWSSLWRLITFRILVLQHYKVAKCDSG